MSETRSFLAAPKWKSAALFTACLVILSVTGNCSGEKVLFDGTTMDGWAHTGAGYFKIDSQEKSLVTMGGMGMLFYYDQPFTDFELTLDFKTTRPDSNSGVFVRFPNLPKKVRPADGGMDMNGPWAAVNEGYEVQICDGADGVHGTGSLYSFFARSKTASKPAGEWNAMKIRVEGQHYQVWVNGEQVGDYTGKRALKGYVGVQNHAHDEEASFRNIRITELENK
jgi:hypothetical protein